MTREEQINTDIITRVLVREGGSAFTNYKDDKPTKYGITIDVLSHYRKHTVNLQELKALTEEEARQIYLENYIIEPKFYLISDINLRELVVDCGVNSGPHTAIIWLQRAVGVKEDGIIGKDTIFALIRTNPNLTYKRICSYRIKFYVKLGILKTQFLEGWINRATSFLEKDLNSPEFPDVV